MNRKDSSKLLTDRLHVVNVGLQGFSDDLRSQQVPVVDVDWSPPAAGDPKLTDLLSRLGSGSVGDEIEKANREALERMLSAEPVLVDVIPAGEAIPSLGERMILHAGPPIGWDRMCGPMRGAIAGIAVFAGLIEAEGRQPGCDGPTQAFEGDLSTGNPALNMHCRAISTRFTAAQEAMHAIDSSRTARRRQGNPGQVHL